MVVLLLQYLWGFDFSNNVSDRATDLLGLDKSAHDNFWRTSRWNLAIFILASLQYFIYIAVADRDLTDRRPALERETEAHLVGKNQGASSASQSASSGALALSASSSARRRPQEARSGGASFESAQAQPSSDNFSSSATRPVLTTDFPSGDGDGEGRGEGPGAGVSREEHAETAAGTAKVTIFPLETISAVDDQEHEPQHHPRTSGAFALSQEQPSSPPADECKANGERNGDVAHVSDTPGGISAPGATTALPHRDANGEREDGSAGASETASDLYEEPPADLAGHALGRFGIYIAVLLKIIKALFMPLVMLVLLLSAIIGERVTLLKLGYLLAFFLNLLSVNLSLAVQAVTWLLTCVLAGLIMLATYLYQFDDIRTLIEDIFSADLIADLGLRDTGSQTALFNYVAPASFVLILSVIQERRVLFLLHSAAAQVGCARLLSFLTAPDSMGITCSTDPTLCSRPFPHASILKLPTVTLALLLRCHSPLMPNLEPPHPPRIPYSRVFRKPVWS
jgi:hypothetical protein